MRSLLVSATRSLLASLKGLPVDVTVTLAFEVVNAVLRRKLEKLQKRWKRRETR
jgi:hypothetical protein